MKSFKRFLTESREEKEAKLSQAEHPEDHFLNVGEPGYHHTVAALAAFHNSLSGEKDGLSKLNLQVNHGGGHVVAGYHPETNHFFVSDDIGGKVNYTDKDIAANYKDAKTSERLKNALKHLPKVIHSGIHGGEYMHDQSMKGHDDAHVHFKAKDIQHSLDKSSDEAKKIRRAKIGVAFHTSYSGKDFKNLKVQHGGKHDFSEHPDVHIVDVRHSFDKDTYTPQRVKEFSTHLQAAEKFHKTKPYSAVLQQGDTLKKYIADSIRKDQKRDIDGYMDYVKKQGGDNNFQMLQHIEDNKKHFTNALNLHTHLEGAKNALVRALSKTHGDHIFSKKGKEVKPPGYVGVTKDNKPLTLVDRSAPYKKGKTL